MITFTDARRKAEAAVGSIERGTLYAASVGYEDRAAFAVNVGAEEWLVDGDIAFMMADAPLVLVDKKTGKTTISTYLDDPDRIDKMSEVSDE